MSVSNHSKRILSPVSFILLAGLTIILSVLPFVRGMEAAWTYALAGLIGVCFIAFCMVFFSNSFTQRWRAVPSLSKLFLALLVVLGLYQELQAIDLLSWSVAPADTERQALLTWVHVIVCILISLLLVERRSVKLFLWLILTSASLQVAVGYYWFLNDVEFRLFGFSYLNNSLTAGFANENLFAAYLSLCLFAGLGLMLLQMGESAGQTESWSVKGVFRACIEFCMSDKFPIRLLLMLLVVGLIGTRSRGGNSVFFALLLVLFFMAFLIAHLKKHRIRKGLGILFVTVVTFDILVLGSMIGLDRVVDEVSQSRISQFAQSEQIADPLSPSSAPERAMSWERTSNRNLSLEDRLAPAWSSLKNAKEFLLFGSGAGTFLWVYPNIKTEFSYSDEFTHAHSDPAQFLIEYGITGFTLFAIIALVPLGYGLRVSLNSGRRMSTRLLALTLTVGLSGTVLHSFIDFPFQVGGISLLWVSLAMVLLGIRPKRAAKPSDHWREKESFRRLT